MDGGQGFATTRQDKRCWGPTFNDDGSVTFRLWAPAVPALSVNVDGITYEMHSEDAGWYSRTVGGAVAGATYTFVLPDGSSIADPASRYQAEGVSGPSILWDHTSFRWTDEAWINRSWEEHVFYELHIGTFTPEGTYTAAIGHLSRLAEIGFTAIELMPLAQFPGMRGWGYDGVLHYAPHHAYGTPEDFKRLVDAAHRCGLAVFLDVVYNHFGPEGNALPSIAPPFFHANNPTPWGARIDFGQDAVRSYFRENVLYWIETFHLDGLRLDAVDQIEDSRTPHILEEMSNDVDRKFGERNVRLIVENPANGTDLLADVGGGRRLYAADWNDEFHHALHAAVTNERAGHYAAFEKAPFAAMKKALAGGYLHEGKRTLAREPPPAASLPPTAFIHFLQNHDQVGNRAIGDRLYATLEQNCFRVLTEILILSPPIPLFFMGDDHLSGSPFHFFADYRGEIAEAVRANRPREAESFGGFPPGMTPDEIADPNDAETFLRSKLDWRDAETDTGRAWADFLKRLLAVRRTRVAPLLADAIGGSGTVVPADDRSIFIDWALPKGLLCLRANLSDHAVELRDLPADCVYMSAGNAVPDHLQPWSTHLFLGSDKGPAMR